MDFAAHRFAENGYHPTSVAEIVPGLGVGKGVFYWYFESKEELLLEILRDAQNGLRRRSSRPSATSPTRPAHRGRHPRLDALVARAPPPPHFAFAATEERFAPALRKGEQIAVADAARHVSEASPGARSATAIRS